MKLLSATILSAAMMLCTPALAQGTAEDYKRAFSIGSTYSNKMTHGKVSVHSKRGTDNFWYSVYTGDSTAYFEVDGSTGKKTMLPGNPDPKPRHRGDGNRTHWATVHDEKGWTSTSPTDKDISIFHRDNNLVIRSAQNERTLTTDGTDSCYYSSWGAWSEDGRYYATVLIKPAPKRFFHIVESSPKDQLQPKLHSVEYAKPGDSLNYRIPVIVDTQTGTVTRPATTLFASQYYVSAPRWDKGSKSVTFEFNERGHKTFRVLEMDLSGNVRTIIEERNDKYIAYSRNWRHDMKDGCILWKSDRDGRAHIYLYDRKGQCRQITQGDFWVRDILHVDEEKGVIFFSANGRGCKNIGSVASSLDGAMPQQDPYFIHYYRIGINGKGLKDLTPEAAHHEAHFSDGYKYLVDTYSTITQPPVTVLRSATDGKVISTLEVADITALRNAGWSEPEVFVAPGRDGKTDMWGIIRRPSNFDPTKKYPVIEYIYAGPGGQYVPKGFSPWIWTHDDLAELGFIVVQLDALGTSFRTLDFEQNCYKNLHDAGFPDRMAWIRAAAEKYPYMDISNMGIYGSSAGGQEALGALLFYGDFYKNAYASCGCHDNRMDKIWWNEQWMGYPVDDSYKAASNVENAHRLNGNLMLVVGERDDNVDPASTMQVVNALQKANKDFELLFITGAGHTMGERYGEHKRYDFFVKNMMGITPPKW